MKRKPTLTKVEAGWLFEAGGLHAWMFGTFEEAEVFVAHYCRKYNLSLPTFEAL